MEPCIDFVEKSVMEPKPDDLVTVPVQLHKQMLEAGIISGGKPTYALVQQFLLREMEDSGGPEQLMFPDEDFTADVPPRTPWQFNPGRN